MGKINFIGVIVIIILCAGCDLLTKPATEENSLTLEQAQEIFFDQVINEANIESQRFSIPFDKDTLITTEKGTKVQFYATSFVKKDGGSVTGRVDIEIKEAFTPSDIVLANLTTISNDGFLESGGMVFVGARDGEEELELAPDKEIGVMLPTSKVDKAMKVFEGSRENDIMNWESPKRTLNKKAEEFEQSYITIWYLPINDDETQRPVEEISDEENEALNNWFWKKNRKKGDRIDFEGYSVTIQKKTVDKVRLKKAANGVFIQDVVTKKGRNGYVSDFNTSYIFSVKKMGWANIDKLYNDPRTQEVDLITKVENQAEFDYVYTTLMIKNKNMYIPGYQRKDSDFGFTHDDQERVMLPVGEDVTIMATAYKDSVPFFAMKKFELAPSNLETLLLEETTIADLKNTLDEKL